jgi:hypothetical protein
VVVEHGERRLVSGERREVVAARGEQRKRRVATDGRVPVGE